MSGLLNPSNQFFTFVLKQLRWAWRCPGNSYLQVETKRHPHPGEHMFYAKILAKFRVVCFEDESVSSSTHAFATLFSRSWTASNSWSDHLPPCWKSETRSSTAPMTSTLQSFEPRSQFKEVTVCHLTHLTSTVSYATLLVVCIGLSWKLGEFGYNEYNLDMINYIQIFCCLAWFS